MTGNCRELLNMYVGSGKACSLTRLSNPLPILVLCIHRQVLDLQHYFTLPNLFGILPFKR